MLLYSQDYSVSIKLSEISKIEFTDICLSTGELEPKLVINDNYFCSVPIPIEIHDELSNDDINLISKQLNKLIYELRYIQRFDSSVGDRAHVHLYNNDEVIGFDIMSDEKLRWVLNISDSIIEKVSEELSPYLYQGYPYFIPRPMNIGGFESPNFIKFPTSPLYNNIKEGFKE